MSNKDTFYVELVEFFKKNSNINKRNEVEFGISVITFFKKGPAYLEMSTDIKSMPEIGYPRL